MENANLHEILQGREARTERQRQLLEKFPHCSLICFTLNIAGPNKNFPEAERTLGEGIYLLSDALEKNKISVEFFEKTSRPSGQEAYFILNKNASEIKKITCEIEESSRLGRLFDIDVFGQDGKQISRIQIEKDARKCLVCQSSASVCARSRNHSVTEVLAVTHEIIQDYFANKFACAIAETAVEALISEVCATPKPGLVDENNCGSHRDMNLGMFVQSANVLEEYFKKSVFYSAKFAGDIAVLLPPIRALGIEAEKQMYAVTGGVNTHMGAIYSIGILCAACGFLYSNHIEISAENIFKTAAKIAEKEGDFGARGEASAGFPHVEKIALPAIERLTSHGFSLNAAFCGALICLMVSVRDTNVLSRGGEKGLELVQARAGAIAASLCTMSELDLLEELLQLDALLISKNLSPGGCADLLAAAIFVRNVEHNLTVENRTNL